MRVHEVYGFEIEVYGKFRVKEVSALYTWTFEAGAGFTWYLLAGSMVSSCQNSLVQAVRCYG